MRIAPDNRLSATSDHLVLLLIARPIKGWAPEFEKITRREIEGLAIPAAKQRRDG